MPPGWRRIAVLTAGPGTRVSESLDAYETTDAMWTCPAHAAGAGLGRAMNRRGAVLPRDGNGVPEASTPGPAAC